MTPTPKFAGWNRRDWVMEVITMMAENGWVPNQIHFQTALLPKMRIASMATKQHGVPKMEPFFK